MRISDWSSDVCSSDLLLRAGELTAIWVPDEAHEAVRDLICARRNAQDDAIGAKQTVRSFLLRYDRRFGGKAAWTKMYWRWLSEQRFRSEEHTSELQSLMRISYAVFCLKKKKYH